MNPWLYLVIGGVFEMMWATTMQLSDGFTEPMWVVLTFAINLVSIFFLNLGIRSGIPVGACYAVWTGCGTILSTISGLVVFGEVMSGLEVFFLAVLVGGVLMLQYFDGKEEKSE